MQVDDDQVVLAFDELEEVDVGVCCISLKVKLVNALDRADGRDLPHKVILSNKSFDSVHVLKVFQTFQLVIGDVNCRDILQILANVLSKALDQVV